MARALRGKTLLVFHVLMGGPITYGNCRKGTHPRKAFSNYVAKGAKTWDISNKGGGGAKRLLKKTLELALSCHEKRVRGATAQWQVVNHHHPQTGGRK